MARSKAGATRPEILGALFLGAAWLSPTAAAAQTEAATTARTPLATTPPATAPAPAATTGQDIVVTGQTPAVTSSIDRKVYSTSRDLQASSGSVADVLRNVPSVDVDAQGNVSLRGDTNVQILIDGRPSTMLGASNRADALQQLSADSIESIEVMTNPSAQFRPDGSSGLINIITKKTRKAGYSGTVQASGGSDGRLGGGIGGAYNKGALGVTANLNLRHDAGRRPFYNSRAELDSASGLYVPSTQDEVTRVNTLGAIAKLGVDYDLAPGDRVSGGFTYNDRIQTPRTTDRNLILAPSGAVVSDSQRMLYTHERETTAEATARYLHKFATKGEQLTLDLRRSETTEDRRRNATTTYQLPVLAPFLEYQNPTRAEVQREGTIEYARPVGKSKLLFGYDFIRDDAHYDNTGSTTNGATGVTTPSPAFINRFEYGRSIHALYTTFNGGLLPSLTANVGLRLEQTDIHTNEVTTGQEDRSGYFRAYPTLHLQYDLSDASNLRVSYSHRVARPEPEDLNPFPIFSDPLNLRAGNPRLKPQETHSFEAGYAYDQGGTSLEGVLYLRKTFNAFTEVRRALSPTVVLTTRDNLGRSTAAGLDFSARTKLAAIVSVSASGTAFYNSIDAGNLGVAAVRSAFTLTAKGSIDAQLSAKDLLQLTGNYATRRLTAQGFRLANGFANIGYRRQLTPALTAVLTVSDVFDSQHDEVVIDSATLREYSFRRRSQRAATLALSWRFGGTGKAPAPARIEYDQ